MANANPNKKIEIYIKNGFILPITMLEANMGGKNE